MSNNFSVVYAKYVPTPQVPGAAQNNPIVSISGPINGQRAAFYPYWNLVQSANIAGGFALVRQLIAAAFMQWSNDVSLAPVGTPVPLHFLLDIPSARWVKKSLTRS
jgi:hypothetical protein